MSEYVKITTINGIGTIEFYHPQSNSLPGNILAKLATTITDAGNDKNIKVIILKSAGERAFCAGASFDELIAIDNPEQGKKFFLGHGDGLGPGDNGYKFIKKVFANKFCQWCFARIHPNLGIGMANYWSRRSRSKNKEPQKFLGADKEWLITYCNKKLEDNHYDYFIFGHRHWPIEHQLQNGSSYINLGDWLQHCTYAVFDGNKVELKKFED